MEFHEKLKRRVADLGINKAKAAREAGLPESTISSYLARTGSLPRLDIATKIAAALKVPLAWLADDSKGWPPPPADDGVRISDVPYTELARELARRYRLDLLDTMASLEQAEKENWKSAVEALRSLRSGELPKPRVVRLLALVGRICEQVLTVNARYDVRIVADFMHEQMPGRERSLDSLQYGQTLARLNDLEQGDFGELLRWSNDHTEELRKLGLFKGPTFTTSLILALSQEKERASALTHVAQEKRPQT